MNREQKRAVVFDMDGTILNTLDDLKDSVNAVLRMHDLPERSLEEVRKFLGNGLQKLMERAAPTGSDEELVKTLFADMIAYYPDHAQIKTRPYDGITEVITRLREEGIATCVVSNKADPAVKALAEHFFPGLFDVAIGAQEGMKNKPAPDLTMKALNEMGVTPDNAIYVGDSDVDLETAINSGLPCVSVLWGFRDEEFLRDHGADLFAKDGEELYRILHDKCNAIGKALIAMSGGVDSSVAACLTKEAGYDCVGCTMRLYENDMVGLELTDTCCSKKDTEDARSVAESMGMPYYIYHYEDVFCREVIEPFVCDYEAGRTPNPCIECNGRLKFAHLLDRSLKLGCDILVTGHYARVAYREDLGRYVLMKAKDPNKDQSYVLYQLTQEQLAHVRFPLGEYTKPEVRAIAEKHGFVTADKSESQDICFVPDGDYARFIEEYRGKSYAPGDFVDEEGHVLGRHKGIIHYTIGQRRGLGIAAEHPLYVKEIRTEENEVVLGGAEEVYATSLTAKRINLITVDRITEPMRVQVRTRYRQQEKPATVVQTDDDTLVVTFDEPQRAVTPGQAVVLYDGDLVVGGGTIISK